MGGNKNDRCQQKDTPCSQGDVEIRGLDFARIHPVMHWCAVHDQQQQAQEKGATAHELKEVQASAQPALGHNLLTDEGQQGQQQLRALEDAPMQRKPSQEEVGGQAAARSPAGARGRLGGGSAQRPGRLLLPGCWS